MNKGIVKNMNMLSINEDIDDFEAIAKIFSKVRIRIFIVVKNNTYMNGVMDLFNSLYLVCNPFDKIIRLLLLYT